MKAILSVSALPPSSYRQYVKGWNKDRYADMFAKYNGDRKGFRIYLPLKTKAKRIVIPKQIKEALHSKGYVVDDYGSGLAVQKDGKRKMRIGKLLPPELQQVFANDPARQAQASDYLVVISRHPYDIAGMSTGRGWRSCMNLVDGCNVKFVKKDVNAGSIIAYLVKSSDTDIRNPSARILLRVYEYNDKVGLWPSKVYGTAPAAFTRTVSAWCSQVNAEYFKIPEGVTMRLHKDLYADDGVAEVRSAPVSVKSSIALLDKQLSAPHRNSASIVEVARSMICFDGPAFMQAATKLPPKKFAALEDLVSSDMITRGNSNNGSPDAEALFSDAELFASVSTRTKYAVLWLKYWATVLPSVATGINLIGQQLVTNALEFAPDVKISAPEFASVISKIGVQRVDNHYLQNETLYAYKRYGLTAAQAVSLVDKNNLSIDPKKVDSDLRDALLDKLSGMRHLMLPAFAMLADRSDVIETLMSDSHIAKSSAGTRIALDRCTKAQVIAFIKSRGGIQNVLTDEFRWPLTKWASYVGGLLFTEFRSGRMSMIALRRVSISNLPLFYCAPQNAKLTDSKEDLEYCAYVSVATRGNYRRTMSALDNGRKLVPFSNSARVLTPAIDFTDPAGLGTPSAQIAARYLPQLFACPVRYELITLIRNAARMLDDHSISAASAGALRLGNPVLLLPFVIGGMDRFELDRFYNSVAAIDQSIKEDQLVELWNFMHS